MWQEHPQAGRVYREEESRYKSDRKQLTHVRRIIEANLKRQQTSDHTKDPQHLPVVDAFVLRVRSIIVPHGFAYDGSEPISLQSPIRNQRGEYQLNRYIKNSPLHTIDPKGEAVMVIPVEVVGGLSN